MGFEDGEPNTDEGLNSHEEGFEDEELITDDFGESDFEEDKLETDEVVDGERNHALGQPWKEAAGALKKKVGRLADKAKGRKLEKEYYLDLNVDQGVELGAAPVAIKFVRSEESFILTVYHNHIWAFTAPVEDGVLGDVAVTPTPLEAEDGESQETITMDLFDVIYIKSYKKDNRVYGIEIKYPAPADARFCFAPSCTMTQQLVGGVYHEIDKVKKKLSFKKDQDEETNTIKGELRKVETSPSKVHKKNVFKTAAGGAALAAGVAFAASASIAAAPVIAGGAIAGAVFAMLRKEDLTAVEKIMEKVEDFSYKRKNRKCKRCFYSCKDGVTHVPWDLAEELNFRCDML